jgi:hypothetical protein
MLRVWKPILLITVLLLTACEKKDSIHSILADPRLLDKEVARCQQASVSSQTPEFIQHCRTIMNLASQFMNSMTEHDTNPESFGAHVLNAEISAANAKALLQEKSQDLDTLKDQHATSIQLDTAKQAVDQAKQDYQQKHLQVMLLLSVLSTSSPD